jgi:Mrp family chromosome partitioning ATPase
MESQAKDLEIAITQSNDTVINLESELNAYLTTRVLTATEAATKKSLEQQLAAERDRLTQMRSTVTSLYDGLGKTNTNQVKIIEKANSSIKVNSNLKLYILVAGMAGLLLCLAFIIAYEYYDDTIKTSREIEDLTGVPVLTIIPRLPPQRREEKLRLEVKDQSNSPVAETYRLLGTKIIPLLGLNILDGQAEAEETDQPAAIKTQSKRTLLVTNLQAGDDSSFIAANLAFVLSQIGIKTILVDSDFHQPRMSELFSLPSEKGLYTMLKGSSRETLTKNLQVISPSLSVLPSGSISSQAQRSSSFFELLVSGNMEDLIKQVKNKAKATILVAPPLTSYSESMVLASRVDSVLLVGYEYRTKRRKVIQTFESLRAYGVQPLGIIMKQKQPNALWKNILLVISKIAETRQVLALKIRQRGSGMHSVPLKRKA